MAVGLKIMRGYAARLFRPVIDYALPPRCAGCGTIVDAVDSFCMPCWQSIDFLAGALCACCGHPLPGIAMDGALCGACLARPHHFDRAQAATAYGTVPRLVAHRLKYGRRTGHARLMARHMARLLPDNAASAIIVPVPLHRWRLWSRGFNQAVLLGRALATTSGATLLPDALRRTVNTPPLHQLGAKARARMVQHAFAVAPGMARHISGRNIILIDDIWTTGATVSACAAVLAKAGASRIDILCWTRVTNDQAGMNRD